jgi:hypothetical protein
VTSVPIGCARINSTVGWGFRRVELTAPATSRDDRAGPASVTLTGTPESSGGRLRPVFTLIGGEEGDKAAFARDGRPCLILAQVSSELRSPARERARKTAELDRVKAASGRLQKVTDWQSEARHEFESAIHDAYKSGASTRQIARVAGVSHARVFQIVSAP